MMALVPSTNTNKEEIHDEFRNMKTFVIKQQQQQQQDHHIKERTENTTNVYNGNLVPSLSLNTGQADDLIYEQIYQFPQYRPSTPASSVTSFTLQRYPETMPVISNAIASQNRQRPSIQENIDIQLPLIETNRPRSGSKYSASRKTTEPLDVLPLKRRRNPINYPLPTTSEDVKKTLLNIVEQSACIATEPTASRTTNSSLRIRSMTREESNMSSVSYSTPTPKSPQTLNSRTLKGVLSSPISTPEQNLETQSTFRLIIQDGMIKDQTENFIQFRQFFYGMWGNIIKVFHALEKLMVKYLVPIALINGGRVAELAQAITVESKLTLENLLSTIINRDEVEKWIKQPGRCFTGPTGRYRAAVLIQSYWRCYHMRCIYKDLRKRRRAAHIIASTWLRYSKSSHIRKQLELTRLRQLNIFHTKQKQFREQWTEISSNRRVVIHLASLGLTHRLRRKLDDLSIRENYHIGSLCELEDPNIDMIYISPLPINGEILQYYHKLINLRTLVEQGNEHVNISDQTTERFQIIVPDALNRFPDHHMCLATLLKYSPKTLKQIKNLINNRPAYMITGISHIDDLAISEYLDIPIYGCEPEVSYLYSTKSGSKRIFKSSNVPMPFGEYDIYNRQHLFEALTRLIIEHPNVQRWIFKIDDDFDGLGIAYCDIAIHLPSYANLFKSSEKEDIQSVHKEFYDKILMELPNVLNEHTVYVNRNLFNSWSCYLKVFFSQGGIIEAYPPEDSLTTTTTICLSIEPNGYYSIICSGDQIHTDSQFSCWGLLFPQTSIDPIQLNNYCSLIVEQCKQRNIYGYIDIDFLSFIDPKTAKPIIWVSDLSIGYSEHVSLYRVMRYITTGEFNPQKHTFTVKSKQLKQRLRNWQNGAPIYTITDKPRFAIWSSKLYHRNLSNLHYSIFFQMCRSHGIGFDVREKQGSIFTLFQGDQHEYLGMITISETIQMTLTNFLCYLNALHREISTEETQEQSNFLSAVNDIENLLGPTPADTSLNTSTS